MPVPITVNGFDLRSLGVVAERVTGPWDVPTIDLPSAAIPGRAGQLALATRGLVQARRIEISGHLLGDSLAQRDARLRALGGLLGAGVVELQVAASATVVWMARLESLSESPYPVQWRAGRHGTRLTLAFVALDPWGYDASALSLGFGATPVPVRLGTAPSAPLVLILGAVTNPTLTYRTAGGLSRCVMGFTIALGAADFLTVDCDAQTMTKSVSGTVTNAMDTWTTTTDGLLVLDPMDGDPVNGVGPTVELAGGSGLLLYRRSWL